MLAYKINIHDIKNNIFIPKYYDPVLKQQLLSLSETHDLMSLGKLIDEGIIVAQTGHEIGKMAYGTGNIPFVRTSDISNWEIKTIPKQGVSKEIYEMYAEKEDVQTGDILMVRDGTYLIGTNCIITELDTPMVYQSHILKFRVVGNNYIDPLILFLCMNSSLVQRQIKNMQFTADIIDTLGNRYREIILPVPKNKKLKRELIRKMKSALDIRVKYKAAIKQMPLLIENVLETNSFQAIDDFFRKSIDEILNCLVQDTTTLELGSFTAYKLKSSFIVNNIYLPKYYDPSVTEMLAKLTSNCTLYSVQNLVDQGVIELSTGDEIGKMAYGTGDIPFVRTSDFSNWEIKSDAKQGISEEIYQMYAEKEDVQAGDILVVRDGTYLVGTSCLITEYDTKMLFCGGLIKIRTLENDLLDEYLLLGLLNSYIVKRQIRTKQFTRDVIDTLGQRLKEVFIPIPNSPELRAAISSEIKKIVYNRIEARDTILMLANQLIEKNQSLSDNYSSNG